MKLCPPFQSSAVLLAGLFSSLVLVTACGVSSNAVSKSDEIARYKSELMRGASLYVEFACVQCHGLGQQARSPQRSSGPSLVSKEFKRTFPKSDARYDRALASVIKNGLITEARGVASMPAWNGILSDRDIGAIVAYIRTGLPEAGVPLPRTSTGEEIYAAFACVKCHGFPKTASTSGASAGGARSHTFSTLGGTDFRARYDTIDKVRKIVLNGKHTEEARTGAVYMPSWGKIGTADQADKVIRYVFDY